MRRLPGFLLAATVGFLALAFPVREQAVTGAVEPAANDVLRIGLSLQPSNALVMVALDQGYFADEGLKVSVKNYPSGTRALSDGMFSGKVDLVTASDVPVVLNSFERQDFSIIATIFKVENLNRIAARADRGVATPVDLKGKRIATQRGSAVHFFLHLFLLENGISEQDIAESLDRALGEAGFERTKPMQRVVTSMPLDGPFNVDKKELEEAYPRRRKSVLDALNALGNKVAELEFYVFHRLDRTPGVIVAELKEYLGEPASEDGMRLSWADGLSVRVVPCAGGPLSDALPRVDLTDEEREGRTRSQQEAIRMTKRDDALVAVEKHMAAHVQNVRGSSRTIGCAILEMPAALRDDRWHDPYSMARRELARWSVLPQVVLVDGKTNDADTPANKYCAAVRDCFRMLGVVPIEDIDLNLAPAAITVVQRNTEFVGGGRRDGHAFPLAARVRDGVLECAIPEESGEPAWMAYGLAALCILSGNYGKFGRGRQEENIAKFEVFFTAVLHQIDRRGSAIVIAEYETVASKLRTLENGRLTFDRLAIGNSSYAPADFPNLRLIRISSDPKKQPHYYHTTEVKWVSGLFSWEAAQRTFYGLKTKPPSVSTEQHFAAQTSRHVVLGDNAQRANDDAARVSAQIDEICVAFMQEDDNPELLATLTHRLRGVHAQYRYDTSAPFPLHELRLLGGGVTL
jgi:hypothetical protein